MKNFFKIIITFILFVFPLSIEAQSFRIIDGKPKNSEMVKSLMGCKGVLFYNDKSLTIDLYSQEGYKELSFTLYPSQQEKGVYIYRYGTEPFSKGPTGWVSIKDIKTGFSGIESFTFSMFTFGNQDIYEFKFARRE